MGHPHQPAQDAVAREATLRQCIEDVYAVFSRYPLVSHIEPDPYFPGHCDDRPLRSAPLRQLPATAFETYQYKSVYNWGSLYDYKHFLPRLLELIATYRQPCTWDAVVEPELDDCSIFSKLAYGQWRSWNQDELQSLLAYIDALWAALLARPVDVSEYTHINPTYSDWLCALAHAHEDISGFIERWDREAAQPIEGMTAAAHLAQTIVNHHQSLMKDNTLDWFYSEGKTQEKQLVDWLGSDKILELMETVFFRWSDSPYAAVFSEARYWLEAWKQARSMQK